MYDVVEHPSSELLSASVLGRRRGREGERGGRGEKERRGRDYLDKSRVADGNNIYIKDFHKKDISKLFLELLPTAEVSKEMC